MGTSDIITLLSLIIAIVAILNEKNRTHVLLKFSRFDKVGFVVAFVLINYFVFYKSFYNRHMYLHALYFDHFGFHNPKNWAYVITIATLVYILYKIYYSFYPNERALAVMDYYSRQIENGEVTFVVDLLVRYHRKDIIRYVQDGPPYDPDLDWRDRFHEPNTRKDRWIAAVKIRWFALAPSSWGNRRWYASLVLNNVIDTPEFLALASPIRPLFFAGFFRKFQRVNRDRFPNDIINPYLEQLLTRRNFWLEKELKESTQNAPTQPEGFFENNPILAALWMDLSVSDVNEVWRPFGEAALLELRAERTKGRGSELFYETRGDEDLWKYTTVWSVQFFYAMINQAIVTAYTECHFFLFYYDRIVEVIIESLEDHAPLGTTKATIIYIELVGRIKFNIFSWLDQSNKHKHPSIWYNILECIGTCVYQVCESSRYGDKRILEWLDSLFFYYCHLENNAYTDELRTKYEEIIKRPSTLVEPGHLYYSYLREAWRKFDKIPHRSPGAPQREYPYFTRLKQEVIIPLGLDVDGH